MRRHAFTLIECMISIAILAILLAAYTCSWLGLAQLRREGDYRFALRNARHQLVGLEGQPFAALPPQLLKPDRQGWLQLGQRDLVAGSLRLQRLDGARGSIQPRKVDAVMGRVLVDPSLVGAELMVDYAWMLADRHEAQVVGSDGRIPLWNAPALRVLAVQRARGPRLEPLTGWRLSADRRSLEGLAALAGQAVVVDYLGERHNVARGTFLDESLQRLDSPSPLKILELREDGAQRPGMLGLSTLRVNR